MCIEAQLEIVVIPFVDVVAILLAFLFDVVFAKEPE
jgi:biopolymer transport protein ExbD